MKTKQQQQKAKTREVDELRQVASAELQVVQAAAQLAQRQPVRQAAQVLARQAHRARRQVLAHVSTLQLEQIQVRI